MTKITTSIENSADSLAVRAAIRRERLTARLTLASDEALYMRSSRQIEECLLNWFSQRALSSFSFCTAIRGEVDLMPAATRLISLGWKAAIAVTAEPDAALVFRAWAPQAVMTVDLHGIAVPDTVLVAAPDVLLIPLLAYDSKGFRLGYGGGYFDRTLAALSARVPQTLAVGVGFALAEVESVMPQSHDQQLDFIITENGLRTISRLPE